MTHKPKQTRSFQYLLSIAVLCLGLFSINTVLAEQGTNGRPLKVGFIVVGPIHDAGWNSAHNQGRLFIQSALGKQVEATMVENVPENSDAERVLEKLIAQGNKLIFLTSYGFLEPGLRVAARHPDVVFMQCNRCAKIKNLGSYAEYVYEPLYIAGMVAGRMTKTNKLGFVAGIPVPPVLQLINAYTLGARSVNPKAKVYVVWTNSWTDAPIAVEGTRALIESGADVLAHIGSCCIPVLQTAEEKGAYSVGTYMDLNKSVPRGWLTGACYNWGPIYLRIARAVLSGTWKPSSELYGMRDECATLASFGNAVPKSVQQEALALERKIKQGEFIVFQGPLKDRDGRESLAKGQKPDAKWLAEMDWFVPGVVGPLGKK